MKFLIVALCLLMQGCGLLDSDAWKHLSDPDKTFPSAFKDKVEVRLSMLKQDVLNAWGKPHDIWASDFDKQTGNENWVYYKVSSPRDIVFNGTYFHWTLRFKGQKLVRIDQEYVTQSPKNLWVFDEENQSNAGVDEQLTAEKLKLKG